MSVKDHIVQPGRPGYVVLPAREGHYIVLRDCPFCRNEARVRVPAQGLWDWEHGEFIQTAMPDLTEDQREMVMTGTHGTCWDAVFGDEDDS